MAISLGNRAKMSTSTTGTGTITLGSASTGYQTFANAGITNGQTVRYAIEDGSNFEIGSGTYTASGTTLTRSVTESSNSDNAISLSGTANVFVTATVADLFINDGASALTTTGVGTFASLNISGGITSGSNIVSDTDSTDDLGTTGTRWANLFVDAITATDQITATGFTGTLDGILGSGTAAAATATTLDTSGAVNLNLVTDSTSSTSGALIVDGGVGIAKKLFVGTDLDVDGTANLDAVDIDGAVDMASTLLVTGVATLTAKPVANAGMSIKNGATSAGFVEFFEDSNNGTNKVTLIGPAATTDITLTLPTSAGTVATTDDATALAIALG